ncbi:hypothetical protein I5H98_gp084 [Mycobacterium phage Whouxphf]|uniref:Uncharacterized protein n=1 Tax=Mycobacterium phage Whouxphf TaxID=2484216 RepID=A0A3G3M1T8_9CAUD|nr:hypothetical protein I5H98_gp084 [Mycobacterium phage Whouxphf]AYR00440.1 hypothetical protein PBI_WHOUXPHF_84 [Mycobacterium phage Whouxphf]
MTSELRDVLTEALREAHYRILGSSSDARVDPGQVLADVVLGLPCVAVIQLPEPDEPRSMSGTPEWYEDSWYVRPDGQGIRVAIGRNHLKTGSAQRLATALAAAVVARGEDK